MKVLWVTSIEMKPINNDELLRLSSGTWLYSELKNELLNGEIEIVVCTSGINASEYRNGSVKYIVLPHGKIQNYKVNESNIMGWETLYDHEMPDIIVIWGTEHIIGYCALLANKKDIPSLVYIQGVMSAVANNYLAGLSINEVRGCTTLIERVRGRTLKDIVKRQYLSAEIEKNIINLAKHIVLENKWSADQFIKINPHVHIHWSRLPINSVYSYLSWNPECCIAHQIITTSAGYPLKGLHVLLRAICQIKKEFPDVKLLVPGYNGVMIRGMKNRLTQTGYCRYISKYIKKNNLSGNVVFIGMQTPEEYARKMLESELFITTSAIENHCASLREAMSIGIPCIATKVGGIPEYAEDMKNCSLIDFGDHEQITESIRRLFNDSKLKRQYSQNGKKTIEHMYNEAPLNALTEIYKEISQ